MIQFVLARAGLPPSSIRQQRLQTAHLGPLPSGLRSVRCAQTGCPLPQGHGWVGLWRTWSRCGSVQEESRFVPCRIRGWSVRRVLKAGVVAMELPLFPRSSLVPPVLCSVRGQQWYSWCHHELVGCMSNSAALVPCCRTASGYQCGCDSQSSGSVGVLLAYCLR